MQLGCPLYFQTIYQLWILWKKTSQTTKKYIDIQSQVICVNKFYVKKSLHVLEDGASGVQVGDIEQ